MATPAPTALEADMLRRWANAPKRAQTEREDSRHEPLTTLLHAVSGDYWQWRPEDEAADDEPIARAWLDDLEDYVLRVGVDAFERHVVPAVLRAIINMLPSAPTELREHPNSDVLRGDLTLMAPEPLTVADVPNLDPERVAEHLGDATFIPDIPELDGLPDAHPAGLAWDHLSNEIQAEVAPKVAELYMDSLRRRLPWTWEPER